MCFRPAAASTPKTCSNCGMVNPAIAEKCIKCGTALEEDRIKCPGCGEMNISTATECSECGRPLTAAEGAPAPSAQSAPSVPNSSSIPGAPKPPVA